MFKYVEIEEHSIEENWDWVVEGRPGGKQEIIGVVYPNKYRKYASTMSSEEWNKYLRKGGLEADKEGNLSRIKPN